MDNLGKYVYAEQKRQEGTGYMLFFSPAGINSLMKNFPEFDQKEIAIGGFGPATAKAVKDAGLRLDLEAPTVEAPSMTAALDMFIRERNKD